MTGIPSPSPSPHSPPRIISSSESFSTSTSSFSGSTSIMSSDDSVQIENTTSRRSNNNNHITNSKNKTKQFHRSPSPGQKDRARSIAAATPVVDNRQRRSIFPKNNYRSPSPHSSPKRTPQDASVHVNGHNNGNGNRDRKTKIQVCVRVRPLLPSDSKHSSSPHQSTDDKQGRKTVSNRHVNVLQPPQHRTSRTRSSSPSKPKASFRKETPDTEPAWTVHNNNVYQSPHTNPDTSRTTDYTFDHTYGPSHSTQEIYSSTVRDSVVSTMEGYHASVFAYGQTATGKTYTMTGRGGVKAMIPEDDSTKGIVQFAIEDCFNYIYNQKSETREYLLRVSFMEIYNEVINDLLAAPTKSTPFMNTSMSSMSVNTHAQGMPPSSSNVRIFESKHEGVIIRGLKEEIVTCPEQVYALLAAGEKRRQTGSTILNKQSSRSHSIFRLIVESRKRIPRHGNVNGNMNSNSKNSNRGSISDSSSVAESIASSTFAPEATAGPVRVSTLSLVDLAGSESVKNTGSTGTRQKEGQYINKSLLTLGHVVYKLAEISSKSGRDGRAVDATHIPYRDSKLTRLLQPSLSGNAQICIICNISPLSRHIEESHLTLKFASRAKRIKQHATITEVVDEKTMLENYREEIEELKRQLKEAKEHPGQGQQQAVNSAGAAGGLLTANASSPDDDEDAFVLSQAISNLERLILKTSTAEEKRRRKRRKEMIAAQKMIENVGSGGGTSSEDGIIDVASTLSNDAGYGDSLLNMLDENDDDDVEDLLANMALNPRDKFSQGKVIPSTDRDGDEESTESMSLGDESTIVEGKKLVTELHRIRGLLGNVLERKGNAGGGGIKSPNGTPIKFSSPSTNNDQEVERLRAQLHEQAVTTSLRKADSTFLQSQLNEKDQLLNDVSQILEAVEKRQVELEAENERLKQEYSKSIAALKSKESEVLILEKLMKKRETEIKKLKALS